MRNSLLTISLILVLAACAHFSQSAITPSPEIMADCFLYFYLSAWNDLNQNGIWDDSEPPLQGVEFQIDGRFAYVFTRPPYLSDEDGKYVIMTGAPGFCQDADYTIKALPPESFEPTTPDTITFSLPAREFSREMQFGFYSP